VYESKCVSIRRLQRIGDLIPDLTVTGVLHIDLTRADSKLVRHLTLLYKSGVSPSLYNILSLYIRTRFPPPYRSRILLYLP
jgi:hypothetical protein